MLKIIYHSQSGSCARLALEVFAGAKQEKGFETSLIRALDSSIAELSNASGLLLIASENSGYLSGGMKEFFDRIFYPAIRDSIVLPYALLISAGNDGREAARHAQRILSGIPLKAVMEPLVIRGELTDDSYRRAQDLGLTMAAGLNIGIY